MSFIFHCLCFWTNPFKLEFTSAHMWEGRSAALWLARKSFQWKYAGKNVPVRVVVCCHFWNLVINFRCFWMKEIYLKARMLQHSIDPNSSLQKLSILYNILSIFTNIFRVYWILWMNESRPGRAGWRFENIGDGDQPIRGQYWGHVTSVDQSEASILSSELHSNIPD